MSRAGTVLIPGALMDRRYRVEARLGRGGMGEVYAVTDELARRRLALKVLRNPERSERLSFRLEFQTLAGLRHPTIVEVCDFGVAPEGAYYTMELLEGPRLAEEAPMEPARACRLIRDIASALSLVHARGLVHRDVTPRNVGLTSDGRAKLLDFGILATAGACDGVAGTVPFVAPEALRGEPVDDRTDLFSLGALAYWLLTGRLPFPARRLGELERLWRTPPPRPSSVNAGVPEALDRLILALLRVDRGARPSGEELIERLGAIGRLKPAPRVEVIRGTLASAALVGRARETGRLDELVLNAVKGRGGLLVFEGPAGIGKSRLLAEAALRAQLRGFAVARASGTPDARPFGTLRRAVAGLVRSHPDEVLSAARPYAPIIGRVLPEIGELFPDLTVARPLGDPREDRLMLQQALVSWLRDLAASRRLVLAVDDAHRGDEASLAVLAALSRVPGERRYFLVVAARTDEPAHAPAAVRALVAGGERVALAGLSAAEVEELARSLFGDVPGLHRFAVGLHRASAGIPFLCLEATRQLIERGALRYEDGIWSLGEVELDHPDPAGLEAALAVRIGGLRGAERRLAEVLALAGGLLEIDLCARLSAVEEDELLASLFALERQGWLARSGSSYRIRHDGLREALVRSLGEERRRDLHLQIGAALLAGGASADNQGEIGWHLLRGGDRRRGAELLARAGTDLYESHSHADALAPLEAALEVLEERGAPPRECLRLRAMLLFAACTCDWESAVRVAPATLAGFASHAGLPIARRLRRFLGRPVAVFTGMLVAGLRWLVTPRSRRGPPPLHALKRFTASVCYLASVHAIAYDPAGLRSLRAKLGAVATRAVPALHAGRRLVECFDHLLCGRFDDLLRDSEEAIAIYRRVRLVSAADRKMAIGGLRVLRATALVARGQVPAEELAELDRLEMRFFRAASLQVRTTFHRWRGEEERARELERETEVLLLQLGASWQFDFSLAVTSSFAYADCRDLIGLKRSMHRLAMLVEASARLSPFLDLARGEYLRESDDLAGSRTALEACLRAAGEEEGMLRARALTALADTLLAAGDAAACGEAAEAASRLAIPGTYTASRAECLGALAAAALRAAPGAVDRLDALLARADIARSSSFVGPLEAARARIALETCLDPNTIAGYLDGALEEAAASWVDVHIDHCGSCRAELSAVVVAGDDRVSGR